jgi:carboxylesterase
LALHGFGGTPREVDLVVGVARELGRRVMAPRLPGHGGSVRDLAATRFEDWYHAADSALDHLSAAGPVVVVGLSMGAVLAARLAASRPSDVRALGLLSNALWLPWHLTAILDLAATLRFPDLWVPKAGSDLRDRAAIATHLTSAAQPSHAAISLLRGARSTRALLHRVTAPVLVVHGAGDRVCPVANARRAVAHLSAAKTRVVILARSRHVVTRDLDRSRVHEELRRFLLDNA